MTKNIETERLILRCFLPEDALQIHPLFCDDEAMRLVGMYPAFTKLKQTQERIGRWAGNPRRLAIVLKNSNKVIGYMAVDSRKEKCEDTKKYEVDNKLHAGANTQRYMLFKDWCTNTYTKLEI